MIKLNLMLFLCAVGMACGSSSAHAQWNTRKFDQVSIASLRSTNQIAIRTLADNRAANLSARLYLINNAKGTRAWLALKTDNGGNALFNCDDGICSLSTGFDGLAPKVLSACFSDGPHFGVYKAVKFDATKHLFASLKESSTMHVVVPVLTGTAGTGLQEEARLAFTFALSELPLTVKGREDLCASDAAGE